MKRYEIKYLLKGDVSTLIGTSICVKGWVRTKRGNKNVAFIALNDGSIIHNIQVVADPTKFEEVLKHVNTGACLCVEGKLVESQGSGQAVEVQAENIVVYGEADPETYPLQKKGHSMEFLREIGHLRLRTNAFGAVMRLRHNMAMAIHTFFHERGFFYFHTPLITASDCEGAGEMFHVSTLDPENPPRKEDGSIDWEQDFFGKFTALTVSGHSNTPRHLAEFWMIEPEMAFYQLDELTALEEEFIKYCVRWALDHCMDDLEFLNKMIDNGLIERLKSVIDTDFVRLPYTEGIKILEEAVKNGVKFEFPISWGVDLASEHERYLVEKHFKKPVIMIDYPKEIKAFYMKLNDEPVEAGKKQGFSGLTVQGTDVLFPQIGEIIGGSVREENYDKLMTRINELNIPMKDMWWYLDTRRFGTCPHAGFGLGFERLMLFVTGMSNIRDVIPFPRTPKTAEF